MHEYMCVKYAYVQPIINYKPFPNAVIKSKNWMHLPNMSFIFFMYNCAKWRESHWL